ncbi:MAG: hypothetical protein KatS3mg057_2315 [Herpetosiphonaceae bacterium]|nr:MAG: hypothetical protein KatS3mg057_2315 [Herpetosiphonaceae bacterium]
MPRRLGGLIWFLVLLLLVGCGKVSVIEAPHLVMPTPGMPQLSDLAITSVDFDPALQGNRLLISKDYLILAAVENRGQRVERNVAVTAYLLEEDSRTIVFSRTVEIAELAPGAVTVVKLGPQPIPRGIGSNLRLIVKSTPGQFDGDLTNNQRDFLIQSAP